MHSSGSFRRICVFGKWTQNRLLGKTAPSAPYVRDGDYTFKWIAAAKCSAMAFWTLGRFQVLIVPKLTKLTKKVIGMNQVKIILRASPSGSSAILHSLSQIIVLFVSGSVGAHFRFGILGFPVAANAAHDDAIFFARVCASRVLPVPCSHRFVLSKQN